MDGQRDQIQWLKMNMHRLTASASNNMMRHPDDQQAFFSPEYDMHRSFLIKPLSYRGNREKFDNHNHFINTQSTCLKTAEDRHNSEGLCRFESQSKQNSRQLILKGRQQSYLQKLGDMHIRQSPSIPHNAHSRNRSETESSKVQKAQICPPSSRKKKQIIESINSKYRLSRIDDKRTSENIQSMNTENYCPGRAKKSLIQYDASLQTFWQKKTQKLDSKLNDCFNHQIFTAFSSKNPYDIASSSQPFKSDSINPSAKNPNSCTLRINPVSQKPNSMTISGDKATPSQLAELPRLATETARVLFSSKSRAIKEKQEIFHSSQKPRTLSEHAAVGPFYSKCLRSSSKKSLARDNQNSPSAQGLIRKTKNQQVKLLGDYSNMENQPKAYNEKILLSYLHKSEAKSYTPSIESHHLKDQEPLVNLSENKIAFNRSSLRPISMIDHKDKRPVEGFNTNADHQGRQFSLSFTSELNNSNNSRGSFIKNGFKNSVSQINSLNEQKNSLEELYRRSFAILEHYFQKNIQLERENSLLKSENLKLKREAELSKRIQKNKNSGRLDFFTHSQS